MTRSPHDDTTLLGPAALGLLTDVEQSRLDRHLERCPACRAELDDLTAVVARLGDLNGQHALLEDLRPDRARADAVLVAIAAERRRLDRHTHRRQSVLAAAAAVAVLAAGLLSATSLTRDRLPAMPLEPVAVSADAGVDARADVVAHTWGVEIKLVASGLADGRPYTVQVTHRKRRGRRRRGLPRHRQPAAAVQPQHDRPARGRRVVRRARRARPAGAQRAALRRPFLRPRGRLNPPASVGRRLGG